MWEDTREGLRFFKRTETFRLSDLSYKNKSVIFLLLMCVSVAQVSLQFILSRGSIHPAAGT